MQQGSYKVCSGLLCSSNELVREAIKRAEEVVGQGCSFEYRSSLIKMVELNLINRKENDRERLNRVFGLQVSHNELWREKKKFVKALMDELNLS